MKRINFLLTSFLSLLLTLSANAAQFIEASDGIEINATISLSEINRIKIEGSKIEGIRVAKGTIEYSYDEKSGDIFINLSRRSRRPVNMFISSNSGSTFKLLLIPKDVPAEQIFLIERVAKNGVQIFNNYHDQLVEFYNTLYSGATFKDYKVKNHNSSSTKGDLKIVLKSSLIPAKPNNFSGNIYEIKNKGETVQMLTPQNFYKKGVRAIKFDSYILHPKEVTKMYIISIAG